LRHTKIIVSNPSLGVNVLFVSSKSVNAVVKFIFIWHCTNEVFYLINFTTREQIIGIYEGLVTRMNLTITNSVFITQVHTVLNQPVGIMNALCCPFGTRMIAKCTLLRAVGSAVCLEEGSIVMIPLGCHYREHLAALKGHFDYVLVRKADSTLSRKFIGYEDVNDRFLNSLVSYHPKVLSGSIAT
jgi:hypothetical protein